MIYTNEVITKKREKEIRNKKITHIIIYIILIPILIYNISLIIESIIKPNETPSFFGIKTFVIISGSMTPELQIGDIVIVKKTDENELKVGDIITYRQGQGTVTHRITQINDSGYKTKGDSNNTEDSGTIQMNSIEGKVVAKVPKVGKLTIILQNKFVIIIIIIAFYIYLLYSGKTNKRKEIRKAKRIKYEERKEHEEK